MLLDLTIPAISAYLASDDTVIVWLINNSILPDTFNIRSFQRICLIINVTSTVFILYLKILYHTYKEERYRREIAGLYNMIKQFALSNFVSITHNSDFTFNLRIFVPEVSVWGCIKSFIKSDQTEKWFVIQNIEPFAKKDITENLRFKVSPDQQGLVGSAYKSGSIVYDDKLPLTNSTAYSLGQTQLSRTSNLRWSICVPILARADNDIERCTCFI